MLPDKNELKEKKIKKVNGGQEFQDFHDGNVLFHGYTRGALDLKQTGDLCQDCEPQTIEKIAPVGDIKTDVPIPSDEEKLINVH